MMPTYEKLDAYISAHGLGHGNVSWEHYITDPAHTAPQDMVTHIYIMLETPTSDY
jgi:effector-binding domain-containing protein